MRALAAALLFSYLSSSFAAPTANRDTVVVPERPHCKAPVVVTVTGSSPSSTRTQSEVADKTQTAASESGPSAVSAASGIADSMPIIVVPPSTSVRPSKPASASTGATTSTATPSGKGKFPFSQVVAFGDNLSDNGNGSVAHCVAAPDDCSNKIYGYGTWTDGPIAVSYLVSELGVPLTTDYAFGHANGGSLFGATIDNAYTQSQSNAPSAKDQIATYVASSPSDITDTLHFLWIGANDINLDHINVDSTNNSQFATDMSTRMAGLVQTLISAGAAHVFVSNLYPKHVSPSSEFYANTPTRIANLGSAVAQANTAIEAAIAPFGSKAIYYDAYSFMMGVWNSHESYGISHVGGEFCDGYSQQDWDLCVTDGEGDTFYWMQYYDMTSYVHSLIAGDMHQALASHFGA